MFSEPGTRALGGQIVSASGFSGAERLYTEYALSLPQRWRMAKSGSRDDSAGGNSRDCRQEHSKASRGDYSVEDSFAVMGATQVSFNRTSPVCLRHRTDDMPYTHVARVP